MKIEGYFDNLKDANKAVSKLKNAGYSKAFVDINDGSAGTRNDRTSFSSTEISPILTEVAIKSGLQGKNKVKFPVRVSGPLVVSGFGKTDEVADIACRVIVNSDSNDIEAAKEIIAEIGGVIANTEVTTLRA